MTVGEGGVGRAVGEGGVGMTVGEGGVGMTVFRDYEQFLEVLGLTVNMNVCPSLKGQVTSEEANGTRLVTKLRWVVESDNA